MSRTTDRDTWLATGLAVIAVPAGVVCVYAHRILDRGDATKILQFLTPLLLGGAGVAFVYGVVSSSAVLARLRFRRGVVWAVGYFLLMVMALLPLAIEQIQHSWEVYCYPIPPSALSIDRQFGIESRVSFVTSLPLKETRRFYEKHMADAGWTLDRHPISTHGEDSPGGGFRSAQYSHDLDIVTIHMVESPEGTEVTILRTFPSQFW